MARIATSRSTMDNILITGGAGFIGSHLAERLLREGKRLAIVDNLDEYYPADMKRANLEEVKARGAFEFFPIDIRAGDKLREVFATFRPDGVIHLAARPGVRMSFVQPEAYTSINVLGTMQVLEISRLSGVQRIVFASSSSVYGHSSRAPFREDASISHPLSIYAATKVAGEALAFTYSHAYLLSVICLRLFTVYGPRQRPDLAIRKFAGMILEGKEVPIFGDGSLERDYTYIDDTVDGILRALIPRASSKCSTSETPIPYALTKWWIPWDALSKTCSAEVPSHSRRRNAAHARRPYQGPPNARLHAPSHLRRRNPPICGVAEKPPLTPAPRTAVALSEAGCSNSH